MRGVEHVPWLYDASLSVLEAVGLGRWRAWLAGDVRGRVLDVGCGTGRSLPLVPGAGAGAVGVDPDAAALRRARRRAPAARLVRGRAEALPFRDRSFDTALCGLVLCSVDDVPAVLSELQRVLRPGGTIRLLEHVRSELPALARLQDAAQPLWTRLSGGCRPNRDTEASVARAGLAIDPATRRRRGPLRRFVAVPLSRSADPPRPRG